MDKETGTWTELVDDAPPYGYYDNTVRSLVYWPGDSWIAASGDFTEYLAFFGMKNWMFRPEQAVFNGAVNVMQELPDSDQLLIGGSFTTIDGVSVARIAKRTGTPDYVGLGSGLDDTCYALWTPDGTRVIAGGAFANAGGSAAAKIAKWSGSAWSSIGTGMNGNTYAIKGRSITARSSGAYADVDCYIGGAFTTADGVTVNQIAKLNESGTSFTALGSGMNGTVYALEIRPNGWVYAGGAFTTAGGKTVNRVARWNGSAWFALGQGFADGEVHSLWWDTENLTLYAGGTFTATTEGSPIPGGVAKFVSGRWQDASEGKLTLGGHDIKAITGAADRLIIAGAIDGEWVMSARTTITNAGTARAYPVITITGPGRLYYLKNNTTGQELTFDYELVADEVVTLNFSPGVKSITSSWRGNILYAVTGGSMVNWYLAPGANDVTCRVDNASATATYSFRPTYWSNDGAVPSE
ncbi:MAG: Cortical protein marker for cell polarity [Chloroflexi bacterium ADurb.Bin360]|nr:MAG: Cortical protein marker for cell polarity [Chloroflexi bacterium ADurb.Bin360]